MTEGLQVTDATAVSFITRNRPDGTLVNRGLTVNNKKKIDELYSSKVKAFLGFTTWYNLLLIQDVHEITRSIF